MQIAPASDMVYATNRVGNLFCGEEIAMSRSSLLWAGLLFLTIGGPSAGQNPQQDTRRDSSHPLGMLEAKELARAKFDADRAKPRALALARLDAAQVDLRVREEQFRAGKVTLDFLLEASRRVFVARQALGEKMQAGAEALEYWMLCYNVERITASQVAAGRVSVLEIALARHARAEAERELHQQVGPTAKLPTAFVLPRADDPSGLVEFVRDLAKARFAAAHSTPEGLLREQLEAAEDYYAGFVNQFYTGKLSRKVPCLHLFDMTSRIKDARLALRGAEADRLAVLEWFWLQQRIAEQIDEVQFAAGRIGPCELTAARYARQSAELELLDRRLQDPNAKNQATLFVPGGPIRADISAKELAKRKREGVLADVRQLALARLASARILCYCHAFEDYYRSFLLLRDAELSVATTPAERIAALERHWMVAWQVEDLMRHQFETARVSIFELSKARYHRFGAEIQLAEARGEKEN